MTDISKIDLHQIDWHQSAIDLKIKSKAFIDGQFISSASGETYISTSPIDGRILAEVASCGIEDVNIAVKSARKAFKSGYWSNRSPSKRKVILHNFAQIIRNNRNELALLETLDMGKPIADSTTIDVRATADCFDWYAEAIDGLFFTGSTQVGKYFMEYSTKSNLKAIGLELGGKSPFLLLESYKDIKRAASAVANSIFFNQGEMCTAPI